MEKPVGKQFFSPEFFWVNLSVAVKLSVYKEVLNLYDTYNNSVYNFISIKKCINNIEACLYE